MLRVNKGDNFSDLVKTNCKAMMRGDSYRAACLLAFSQEVLIELGWEIGSAATPGEVFASAKQNKTIRAAKKAVLDRALPGVKNCGEGTFGTFLDTGECIAGLFPALWAGALPGFEPTGADGEVKLTNSAALRKAFQAMEPAIAGAFKEMAGAPKKPVEPLAVETGPEDAPLPGETGAPPRGPVVESTINIVQLLLDLESLAELSADDLVQMLGATLSADLLMAASIVAERRCAVVTEVVEPVAPMGELTVESVAV